MLNVPVVVLTNDKHLWCLKPFSYCFNTFWDHRQIVDVWGFNAPKRKLPSNFVFHSIGRQNYPVNKWTNGLAQVLRQLTCRHFILLLEDYWFTHKVNQQVVHEVVRIANETNERVLRIDLSADRFSKRHYHVQDYDGFKLIGTRANSLYQMSYQAAVWNRELLLEVLVMGETPWQSEVEGTKRLAKRTDLLVWGTNAQPLKYIPAVRSHKRGLQHMQRMPEPHRTRLQRFLPKGIMI